MLDVISNLLGRLRVFFAPRGRHRPEAAAGAPASSLSTPSTAPTVLYSDPPRLCPAPSVRPWYEPIDGSATPLVRPYLTAYECEEKSRLQRLRRDALWLAEYGVDLDTRDIHAFLGAAS